MGDPYLAAQRTTFHAYGWSGLIEVETGLDGDVANAGVERYSGLDGHHLTDHRTGFAPHGVAWIACRTTSSRTEIALAVRTVTRPRAPVMTSHTAAGTVQTYRLPVAPRRSATVVKTAAAELDVGVPARGLHGEAYRGHVFWDELFVLPYITLHFPEVARALLMYRHRRLPAARDAARLAGQSGAMFPWQSGSSGQEESQALHLNPRSGRWLPDHSHLQRHVGSAIALNVCRYGRATGDTGFLYGPGAELLLEIARFWAGAAVYDAQRGRYRIRGVLGPDEYHYAYPAAGEPGIDDNAYTNVMAAWVIHQGLELLDELPPPHDGRN